SVSQTTPTSTTEPCLMTHEGSGETSPSARPGSRVPLGGIRPPVAADQTSIIIGRSPHGSATPALTGSHHQTMTTSLLVRRSVAALASAGAATALTLIPQAGA